MHRAGLGGFQNFDAALQTPQVVPKRLAYMTPDWKDAFKHAILLGDQLGLEMAIAGSPGWSESGGPWVPGSEGHEEVRVERNGGPRGSAVQRSARRIRPRIAAHFRTRAYTTSPRLAPRLFRTSTRTPWWSPIKRPTGDKSVEELQAKITASGGSPDFAMLTDGDLEKTTKLPIGEPGHDPWIQYEFPQPQTIRAVTYRDQGSRVYSNAWSAVIGVPEKVLEASDDGQNFREVTKLNGDDDYARAHHFLCCRDGEVFPRGVQEDSAAQASPTGPQGIDPESFGIKLPPKPTDYEIAELVLHAGPRVNQFEEKAAFVPVPDLYHLATSPVDGARRGDRQVRCRRSHLENDSRRQARLDTARRRLGGVALWLFAAGHQQPSRHGRGHRSRSRQDGPPLCEELFREIPRQLQGNRRRR